MGKWFALAAVVPMAVSIGVARLVPANSVGSKQVIDHSLLNRDFKQGVLLRGRRGPRGPTGAQGPQGTSSSLHVVKIMKEEPLSPAEAKLVYATCPAGTTLIGGGYTGGGIDVAVSAPTEYSQNEAPPNSWVVLGQRPPGGSGENGLSLRAIALCS